MPLDPLSVLILPCKFLITLNKILGNNKHIDYIGLHIEIRLECTWGRKSSVGIATRYGLDGPGPNPGGGEIFCTRPDRPWGPPSVLYNGYRVFPRGKAAGA